MFMQKDWSKKDSAWQRMSSQSFACQRLQQMLKVHKNAMRKHTAKLHNIKFQYVHVASAPDYLFLVFHLIFPVLTTAYTKYTEINIQYKNNMPIQIQCK